MVQFEPRDLTPDPASRRCEMFFYLGVSVGKLLERSDPVVISRGGCQLMEELEHYFSNAAVQSMKLLVAPTGPLFPTCSMDIVEIHEPFRPLIKKWENRPVYECLYTPVCTFPLDYVQVTYSLCELLTMLYSKLCDESCVANVHVFETVLRLDRQLNSKIYDVLNRQLSAKASELCQQQLRVIQAEQCNSNLRSKARSKA